MRRRRRSGVVALATAVLLSVVASGLGRSTTSFAHCHSWQLRVAATDYGEALGSFLQTFTFTNASRQTCSLRGWPSLEVERRSGRSLPVRSWQVRQGGPTTPAFHTVVIRARGAASFDVYGEDWDHTANKPCPQTRRVLITPPGTRSALSARVKMPNCGFFEIAPVIAGKKDRQWWSVVWHK
jgi:hypothetical protein